ncbi:MAG: flagellar basal body rod protein FlgB [Clostridiales bacterium]|nr:flagellar basal body rod protein FlgB [Clostridiales bacterium]
MQDFINNSSLQVAQKSLDSLWMKQKVISNNIANMNTPGYKSKTVEFENLLKKAIASSSNESELAENLSSIEPRVEQNNFTSGREDGNNVDIDSESIELVRTQIQYEYMTSMIANEISRMKYAINGGR